MIIEVGRPAPWGQLVNEKQAEEPGFEALASQLKGHAFCWWGLQGYAHLLAYAGFQWSSGKV